MWSMVANTFAVPLQPLNRHVFVTGARVDAYRRAGHHREPLRSGRSAVVDQPVLPGDYQNIRY
jgi:hypothetical protein